MEVCKASRSLGLEPKHHHFDILLAKASYNTSPGSSGGDVDSTSFFKKKLVIFLFLAVMGLHCCAGLSSSCNEWRLLFVAVSGLLIAVASLVAKHGL